MSTRTLLAQVQSQEPAANQTSKARDYTQAVCCFCDTGEKNAHVFIRGARVTPACREHAAQYVIGYDGEFI